MSAAVPGIVIFKSYTSKIENEYICGFLLGVSLDLRNFLIPCCRFETYVS
jgi:hypothetical protein